jgi:hypothetical protein
MRHSYRTLGYLRLENRNTGAIETIKPKNRMAILKFRIYFEEDDAVYRDVAIKHSQNFRDLHLTILKAYEFDSRHQATFYRSNDNWQRGREITLELYDKPYKASPLLMAETIIRTEIFDTNQKFIYTYDFNKNWTFLVELINVSKEESSKVTYPAVTRTEGIGPQQYGTRSLLGDKFVDIEEKYDLSKGAEGFGREGVAGEGDENDEAEEAVSDEEEGIVGEEEY